MKNKIKEKEKRIIRILLPGILLRIYGPGNGGLRIEEKTYRRISLPLEHVATAYAELRQFSRKLSVSDMRAILAALREGRLNECTPDKNISTTIAAARKERRRKSGLKKEKYDLRPYPHLRVWMIQHCGHKATPETDDYVATTAHWLRMVIRERRSTRTKK